MSIQAFIEDPSSCSHSDGVLDVDADDGDVVVGLVRLGVRLHVRDVHHRLHSAAHSPEHGVLEGGGGNKEPFTNRFTKINTRRFWINFTSRKTN